MATAPVSKSNKYKEMVIRASLDNCAVTVRVLGDSPMCGEAETRYVWDGKRPPPTK